MENINKQSPCTKLVHGDKLKIYVSYTAEPDLDENCEQLIRPTSELIEYLNKLITNNESNKSNRT